MVKIKAGFVILFLILCISIEGAKGQDALKKASLTLQWSAQAQFTGYYVAYDLGIYKKYGIDLTIIPGGPDSPTVKYLEEGKTDFGTIWLSSALQKYAKGVKLVNLAQIIRKSSLMFIAKKSSGIKTPEDMNNKKVGLFGSDFQWQLLAFLEKYRLNVHIINQPISINLFLRDGVDVTSAMWYNEYHTILNAGYNPDELVTFFFSDYNLNYPEDGIYCLEKTYSQDQELCRNFVCASIEGWQYAFENQDRAVDTVMKYMMEKHLIASRTHQQWMLRRMQDIITGDSTIVGKLYKDDYVKVATEMKTRGLIKIVPEYEIFYRECIKND